METVQHAGPPVPPELPRALRLTLLQRLGLPVLFAIPVLALFGVFGEHYATVHAGSNGIAVDIEYPDRMHYRQPLGLRITVRNTSDVADSMIVAIDTSLLAAFSTAHFTPPLSAAASVTLRDVRPGDSRTIHADVSAQRYWRSAGDVTVQSSSGRLRVPLSTFVFP